MRTGGFLGRKGPSQAQKSLEEPGEEQLEEVQRVGGGASEAHSEEEERPVFLESGSRGGGWRIRGQTGEGGEGPSTQVGPLGPVSLSMAGSQ